MEVFDYTYLNKEYKNILHNLLPSIFSGISSGGYYYRIEITHTFKHPRSHAHTERGEWERARQTDRQPDRDKEINIYRER